MSREGSTKHRVWPWRKGLATAGQQSSIPEDALWQAKNFTAGLDGLLQKRPGLKQWGQTIKAASTLVEPLLDSSLPGWIESNDDSTLLSTSVNQGFMRLTALAGSGNETLVQSWDGTVATDVYVRMLVQAVNLSAYDGSATNADTFHFRIAKDATTGWEFALWSGGLYYKKAADNQYTLVTGTADLGAGAFQALDISIDADGNTLVYVSDTLVDTIATSLIATPSLTRANSVLELALEVHASKQQGANIVTPMLNNSTTAPSAVTLTALTDFRGVLPSGVLRSNILAAAGDYIYHDPDLSALWRPLVRKSYTNVEFFPYRTGMAWVEHNGYSKSKLLTWDGSAAVQPVDQDNAPPCRFGTEHQTRIWVAGDRRYPLRVYYSGDRQPNLWFAPDYNNISDRYDTQLQAGYLEVPSRRGDEITALYGDYYGQLIVWTKQAVYRVVGSGAQTYAIQSITQDVGAVNNRAVAQVGKDIWFLSEDGVHSLATTDQYGDLVNNYVSGMIQDLFGGRQSTVTRINKTYLHTARMAYSHEQGLVYVAFPLGADQTAGDAYVFNVVSGEWYGPWEIDCQAMEEIELGVPDIRVVANGGTAGQVLYTDQSHKSDNGTAIDAVLESAIINGRTLAPDLVGLEKTFKRLRIYVLPRGEWDIKVFWRVDQETYQDENSTDPNQNKSQNVFEAHGLTTEFKLGADPAGVLHSAEEMGYIEVILDKRGYGLSFKIEQDQDGEDIVIQGYEIDFVAHGYARD